jgi:alkanesulfonate monooxygenase
MYPFELFSECPVHTRFDKSVLMDHCALAKTAELHQFAGSLVYYEHLSLDPFIAVSYIFQKTKRHIPLIALQPYAMPPFTAAKIVHSILSLYRRKLYLNMVSGQVERELEEVGDTLDKKARYRRLIEYTTIVRLLLTSNEPLTFQGDYYHYKNLQINSAVPPDLMPKIYLASGSGSSESLQAASQVGDVLLSIADSKANFQEKFISRATEQKLEFGMKVNIISGRTKEEALTKARQSSKFRERTISRNMLKAELRLTAEEEELYYPGNGDRGNAPLWVGSYEQVAAYAQSFVNLGVSHFIIQNADRNDTVIDCGEVFRMVKRPAEIVRP